MYRIGIDLGGTNIVAGVVDDSYRIIGSSRCKTLLPRPAKDIIEDMAKVAIEAAANANISFDDISYVGVGCPGTCNNDNGIVEYSNNLDFVNVPIRDILYDTIKKPIYIENDANAAALGETLAGAAKGAQSSVCITLGTGVGGGIIIDGKIYSGFNFSGGELGHIVIMLNGEPCTCGRNGCWESYASATALIRQTKTAMQADKNSIMWKIAKTLENVDGRTSFDAMRQGDKSGRQVVNNYINYLASGLINVINIFQPEVLCLGGGICKEGDTLIKPLEKLIEKERYSRYSACQTRLFIAELGNDAGIIGAACIGQ